MTGLPHFMPANPTAVDLDYADLPVIDLSKCTTPEARKGLAIQVRDAMTTHGFFYAINHGYTVAQTDRIVDIADLLFAHVTPEEKQAFVGTMKETGSYQGYKLRKYWHIDSGVHDEIEHYSIHRDVTKRAHPQILQPYLSDVAAFARHTHLNVLYPILRLLALGLELPEDALVDCHGFSSDSETYVRFMKYYPHSEDEETKTKNVWLKGHTDIGTVSILYSQPVAALQILTRSGQWKWVKHMENAAIINAGDALEFLSGGFYRATIHRVIQPPEDQRNHNRLGLFYFCMSDDNIRLVPFADSPVLKRIGIKRRFADRDAPTTEVWRKARTSAYGQSELKPAADKGVEEEVVGGVLVRHYN
ncbi:hypothetical protein BDZ94DRAFT_161733 [Collybia nuda]|uniref:Clavaminate synthase-like protein n=1 Tax=Collybia nuda TaxID=64659 RepID=A0A9P6CEC6_9AGAR|nr:hypothetical protein BDZ94DRAFT_161733 [Collybia nuda]